MNIPLLVLTEVLIKQLTGFYFFALVEESDEEYDVTLKELNHVMENLRDGNYRGISYW